MNIALLGGCGYIGSRLYQHLSVKHRVSSFDLELRGNPGHIRNVRKDYRNLTDFKDFDAVILLAGHSGVAACEKDRFGAMGNNLIGPIELARKLTDQIFIYASSASVYGTANGERSNVYDFTKATCDEAMKFIHPNHYALRLGTLCGWSHNMRLDLVLNAMVHDAKANRCIRMRNPSVKRAILGMHDLCSAIDAILAKQMTEFGHHNLCSANTTIEAIANAVSKRLDAPIQTLKESPTYNFRMEPSAWFANLSVETLPSMIDELASYFVRQKAIA